MTDAEEKTMVRVVADMVKYDPQHGLVFSGSSKAKSLVIPESAPISMTLHYETRSVPVVATFSWLDAAPEDNAEASFEIVLPLSEDTNQPLCSVSCNLPEWLSLDAAAATFLAEIFPRDNKAYEALFLRKMQRFGDAALQYFVARQLSQSFTGLRAYRVGAAVIMTYKAIEIGDPALQEEALHHVQMQMSHLDECEITNRPRTNREHLQVSMFCAQWHLELSLGRYEDFLKTLERGRAAASGISNYFTPAFNLSLTLLIYCTLLVRRGDIEEAVAVADEGMHVFKSAVASATHHLTLFEELRIAHRNVHMMLCSTKPDKQNETNFKRWIRSSLRVTGAPAERLKDAALSIYPAPKAS